MVPFIRKANDFNRMEHVSNAFAMKNLKHKILTFTFRNVSEKSVELVQVGQSMIILIVAAFQFMTKRQQFAVQLNGDVVSFHTFFKSHLVNS